MPRYINAEDLGLTDFEIVMCDGDYKQLCKLLLQKIESAPAADVVEASSVVEIVHCKECKFGEWNAVECAYWCQGRFHRPDWYCADAISKYEDVVK